MTRIVRFEEIDGQLVLRVPEDVAKRLGFAAGGEAVMTDGDKGLTVERVDERKRAQLAKMLSIVEEDDAVLSALAK